ncbi:MerC domain-containing protein [Bermanella marisrubri]|uniref:MerC mercury resistance protein n=1 Tax=Bermanella marisrubri TaxID=207949 RepID=Q1N3U6_9GAMM|nr:MerC domain-containing protein [Bermanella marisrubri]EAT12778.1 hypothetical protein RED65_11934 [Oceanobacter sp. RED65] [Bermanella marisrubri]QIZ83105.1 MerC domain-containing protein [Bermanella marisrubri]
MMSAKYLGDKIAISLSLLCLIHCIAMPIFVVFVPASLAVILGNESVHMWMLIAVIPFSAIALYSGCKKHKRFNVTAIGIIGLTLMVLAVAAVEPLFGHEWEVVVTVIGAIAIAAAHFKNYRLCQGG